MSFREITGTARAEAILEAAGAFDTSPIAIATNQYESITFLVRYQRGAVAGATTYKIEFSNDKVEWFQASEFLSATVTSGVVTPDLQQTATVTYTNEGGVDERFMTPSFKVAANFIRIVFQESGAVGTPGTVTAEFYLQREV